MQQVETWGQIWKCISSFYYDDSSFFHLLIHLLSLLLRLHHLLNNRTVSHQNFISDFFLGRKKGKLSLPLLLEKNSALKVLIISYKKGKAIPGRLFRFPVSSLCWDYQQDGGKVWSQGFVIPLHCTLISNFL